MSGFKDKSHQNRTSAEVLIKCSHYSSSIHCSFYSCIQYMLHILFFKLNKDKTEFNLDIKYNNTGTHSLAAKLIGNEIAAKDSVDYKWFQGKFPELKRIRESADYSEFMMKQEEGYDALSRADAINNLLTKYFK